MKALWNNMLIPATAVAVALVHTMASLPRAEESASSAALRAFTLPRAEDSLKVADTVKPETPALVDTVALDSLMTPAPKEKIPSDPDSLKAWVKARYDSLRALMNFDDDDDFDNLFVEEDTMPRIDPRDTTSAPDSLKLTDPFLYKWYFAIKDTMVHRIVVDSLKAEGDSLEWPIIDSLFVKDSIETAKRKFDEWYSTLSKKEKRKYKYQQALPAKLHRMDSILNRKDSLKNVRDSIREETPRILQTFAVPDSLFYKRLITWTHDRYFNRADVQPYDTSFNYRFYDYPYKREDLGGNFLGVAGSAVEPWNFLKRRSGHTVSFYDAYESWTYTPETMPMYNTKTPYTELGYAGTLFAAREKESDNIRIFTTQNIIPALNISFEFNRFGGGGILQNEETKNRALAIGGNWLGKKYLAHAGFIHNRVDRTENGGVVDRMWIRDTTVDAREIAVNLASASNSYRKNTVFFDQSFRFPFNFIKRHKKKGDTTDVAKAPADTFDTSVTTFFIGTATEYSAYSKSYTDVISDDNGRAFFNNVFNIHPAKSADSLRVARLDNRIFIRLQPWKADGIVSKIEGGVGDRFQTHYMMGPGDYIRPMKNTKWNSIYVYAGAEGQFRKYIFWDATGSYTFAGHDVNDFFVNANATFSFYPFRRQRYSPLSLKVHFETSLTEPDYFQRHFYSNHYSWTIDDPAKISLTKIQGALEIPHWKLRAEFGYSIVKNHIYYGFDGCGYQDNSTISIMTASLMKNFAFAKDIVHLDHNILFQLSSKPEVIPLPMLAFNLRYYVQFNIVRPDVMKMQIGLNAMMTTKWYAPGFNPVTGTFMNQDDYKYGLCPVMDVFMNLQWKRCTLFIKGENIGQGWPMDKKDYFTANNYIGTQRAFKIGIWWPFYIQSAKLRTLSSRAGSGVGGSGVGGGLGGGLGGLKGAINGR